MAGLGRASVAPPPPTPKKAKDKGYPFEAANEGGSGKSSPGAELVDVSKSGVVLRGGLLGDDELVGWLVGPQERGVAHEACREPAAGPGRGKDGVT